MIKSPLMFLFCNSTRLSASKYFFFELVKIAPPDPDVIILLPLKLKIPRLPKVPKCFFL